MKSFEIIGLGYGPNHIIPKKRFQELINKVTALQPYFSKHNIYQPWWLQPKQTVYLEKAINFNQFRKKWNYFVLLVCDWLRNPSLVDFLRKFNFSNSSSRQIIIGLFSRVENNFFLLLAAALSVWKIWEPKISFYLELSNVDQVINMVENW